jgi:repressor LexA
LFAILFPSKEVPMPASRGDPTRERILAFLERCAGRGVPPTVREIGEAVGLSSPASVHRQLRALEEHGRIAVEEDGRSRRWRLAGWGGRGARRRGGAIPVVGRIAAGEPIESLEAEESLPLPPEAFAAGEIVALRVEGESMTGAGIFPGDYAIIRRQPAVENGEVAAVTIDGCGTLKVWRRSGRQVALEPRARGFATIRVGRHTGDVRVFGRLVGLARLYTDR